MDILLRLRNLRHRQTPCNLKRVKAHALRRELSTFVLDYVLSNSPIIQIQESKSGCSSYMSFHQFSLSLSHRHEVLMFTAMMSHLLVSPILELILNWMFVFCRTHGYGGDTGHIIDKFNATVLPHIFHTSFVFIPFFK